jgi:hypothetical protein
MLGFVIGAVCVVGLVKVLRHRHFGRVCHPGGDFRGYFPGRFYAGSDGGGLCGGGGGLRRNLGRRWILRSLFERLETTPGQEKAILSALDRLRDERSLVGEELKETRSALARVVESGLVDDSALEETFARHDRVLAQVRVSFVEALKTVVEALDERQRKELASLIAGGRLFGSRFGGFGGPDGVWA